MIARYSVVLVSALVLYGVSCAPGTVWQDGGLFQYRVWHNDLEGFEGLAVSHPLYHLVALGAKQVPFGEFGRRVNLVSAAAAAFAVANLYLLMRLWLGRDFPAVIAALTLAVSHTFWWHASLAETYTLWAALFLGELVVLLQYTRTRKAGYLYGPRSRRSHARHDPAGLLRRAAHRAVGAQEHPRQGPGDHCGPVGLGRPAL
jgi:hypothetical protein